MKGMTHTSVVMVSRFLPLFNTRLEEVKTVKVWRVRPSSSGCYAISSLIIESLSH